MRRFLFAFLLAFSFVSSLFAQQAPKKPKLVVGIIVDQMRQEYLYRFADRFGEGGFKRFTQQGFHDDQWALQLHSYLHRTWSCICLHWSHACYAWGDWQQLVRAFLEENDLLCGGLLGIECGRNT